MAVRKKKVTGSGRDPSRKRNASSETGVFRSIRDRTEHVYESAHERDNLIAMDVDPEVLSFEVQPTTFPLGGRSSYTPDVRVVTVAGEAYREVKPAAKIAKDPSLKGRIDAIVRAAAAEGADFGVVDEAYYRDRTRRADANLLRHSAKRNLPFARDQVLRIMANRPAGATLLELVRELGMGIVGRFAVLGLVAIGTLDRVGDGEIGPDTMIVIGRLR